MGKQNYYDFLDAWEADAEQVAGLTLSDEYYFDNPVDDGVPADQDEHDSWEEID